MTREQKLNRFITTALLEAGFDPLRVETSTVDGVPDINVCMGHHREAWIEAKAHRGKQPVIRATQRVWMHRRTLKGGCCLIVHRPEGDVSWGLWAFSPDLKLERLDRTKEVRILNPPMLTGRSKPALANGVRAITRWGVGLQNGPRTNDTS